MQAYISGLKLEGLALMADLVYISQSAGRLMRCLFEICLRRNWAPLAEKALLLCKAVTHRMWTSQSPLRQFRGKAKLPNEVLSQLEKKEIPWERCGAPHFPLRGALYCCRAPPADAHVRPPLTQPTRARRYFDMRPAELGELVRNAQIGRVVHKLVSMVPRLQLEASIQPLTRGLLRIDLVLTPDFRWDEEQHGFVQPFLITVRPPRPPFRGGGVMCISDGLARVRGVQVEDQDSEFILHKEFFYLKMQNAVGDRIVDHNVAFTVPIADPLPPQYFIRIVSDRWLGSESYTPVSFKSLVLPRGFNAPSERLDLNPLPVSALRSPRFERLYRDFKIFNPIQTQARHLPWLFVCFVFSAVSALFSAAPRAGVQHAVQHGRQHARVRADGLRQDDLRGVCHHAHARHRGGEAGGRRDGRHGRRAAHARRVRGEPAGDREADGGGVGGQVWRGRPWPHRRAAHGRAAGVTSHLAAATKGSSWLA